VAVRRAGPPDRELDALHRALDDAGVALVALNFDAGDMAAGERGLLSRPGGSARFRENVEVAVGFAAARGCPVLNALYGNRDVRAGEVAQRELAVENLVLAAHAAARTGATVVIEALNAFENPDYPLTSCARRPRAHRPAAVLARRVERGLPGRPLPPGPDGRADRGAGRRARRPVRARADRRLPGRGQPGTGAWTCPGC
jgi:hydroxypyruvate isomerase